LDDVVSDLRSALEVGKSQGSFVLSLRAANELARLPVDSRPSDWRGLLTAAAGLVPPSSTCAELAEARALLNS
jgi:hypothetical protein